MPPSGFSQKAINGLLAFIRDSYQCTLDKYRNRDLTEEQTLRDSMNYLESLVEKSAAALEGTVSAEGIKGLQQFISTNYKDLIREIHEGKKQEGKAMQAEIDQIGKYLAEFKI